VLELFNLFVKDLLVKLSFLILHDAVVDSVSVVKDIHILVEHGLVSEPFTIWLKFIKLLLNSF